MSPSNMHDNDWISVRRLVALLFLLLGMTLVSVAAVIALITGLPVAQLANRALNALFAVNSVQALWYVTRAAGLIAYLLLWLSTAWGVAVSSKIFDPVLQGAFTYDFHQFLSLFAIGFIVLHVVVLLADQYLPFSVAAILVPFVAPYRPLWVGIGVIGFYLTLLVSVTFYVRQRIGMKAFRMIHLASFVAYVFAAIHGLMAGTDSPLLTTRLMYAGTTLVIVFLTTYWIMMSLFNKRKSRPVERQLGATKHSMHAS
jgi:sulfoxide reductase heme-binding subunit YedZ